MGGPFWGLTNFIKRKKSAVGHRIFVVNSFPENPFFQKPQTPGAVFVLGKPPFPDSRP